jgi:hypothetical protein
MAMLWEGAMTDKPGAQLLETASTSPPGSDAAAIASAATVTEQDLADVARYLVQMGVPELAGNYFPRDTRWREKALLGLGILGWAGAIFTFFVITGSYGTSAYGTHLGKWYWFMGICLFVGIVGMLMSRELRFARTGRGVTRRTPLGYVLRTLEFLLWLAVASLFAYNAISVVPGDPGSVAITAILVAALAYRFPIRRFTGRNIITFTVATFRAVFDGARQAPRLATTVPWMVGIVVFLFISGDAWRLFGRMEVWRFWWLVGLSAVFVVVILWRQLPKPFEEAGGWKPSDTASHVVNTPAAALVRAGVEPQLPFPSLGRQTRLSLVAPIWLARSVRVLASATALAVILLVIGFLVIGRKQTQDLAGTNLVNVVPFAWNGMELDLSDALVKVAILLSLIGAAYFVTVTLTDPAARKAFINSQENQRMYQVLAAWTYFSGALKERKPYFMLSGKPVYRCDLRRVDLCGEDLSAANLDGINLSGCRADDRTRWPAGFDPVAHGVKVHYPLSLGPIRF